MQPATIIATIVAVLLLANRRDSAGQLTRIEEARFIRLGGIEQWITIRGDEANRPIVLLLHGGPGDVQSAFTQAYALYEKHFVLVQWDQRGAGRTFAKYRDQTPDLSLDRVASDGIELAEYLRKRFPSNPIVALGHSWGSVIATVMVTRRPELFAAYVGTGQVSSWAESAEAQLAFLRSKAKEPGNEAIRRTLDSIGPVDPTNAAQYFSATRPLRNFMTESDNVWLRRIRLLARDSSGLTVDDLATMSDGMRFSGRAFLSTQMGERLSATFVTFELPYFVIQGEHDWFTPTAPAKSYFDRVVAPRKRMIVLEGAGHFALVTHPRAFIAALESMLYAR